MTLPRLNLHHILSLHYMTLNIGLHLYACCSRVCFYATSAFMFLITYVVAGRGLDFNLKNSFRHIMEYLHCFWRPFPVLRSCIPVMGECVTFELTFPPPHRALQSDITFVNTSIWWMHTHTLHCIALQATQVTSLFAETLTPHATQVSNFFQKNYPTKYNNSYCNCSCASALCTLCWRRLTAATYVPFVWLYTHAWRTSPADRCNTF